jgi:hypothetical protein
VGLPFCITVAVGWSYIFSTISQTDLSHFIVLKDCRRFDALFTIHWWLEHFGIVFGGLYGNLPYFNRSSISKGY